MEAIVIVNDPELVPVLSTQQTFVDFQDVLKTSWRRLQDMSSRSLKDMSSKRLEDLSSRRSQDMPSRLLQDVYWNVYWEYLYLKNLDLYLIDLHLTYLYLTNQGESKMH